MPSHELLYPGSKYAIYAFRGADGRCDVLEFLQDRQQLSEKDEKSFRERFVRHGDHGPIHNTYQCRLLEDGIYEYKANDGGRIAWFYVPGSIVMCACGTLKKKQKADPGFIERARKVREQYKKGVQS